MDRTPHNATSRSAFTLVEVLVVIAVIAILASVLFPAISTAFSSSKAQSTRTLLAQIGMAIAQYQDVYRKPPPDTADTSISAEALPFYLGPERLTVKKLFFSDSDRNGHAELLDAWGYPFIYNSTSPVHNPKSYDLFSCGRLSNRIIGDPGKMGLQAYQNRALQTSGAYYTYERQKVGNKTNDYIGNW